MKIHIRLLGFISAFFLGMKYVQRSIPHYFRIACGVIVLILGPPSSQKPIGFCAIWIAALACEDALAERRELCGRNSIFTRCRITRWLERKVRLFARIRIVRIFET